MKDNELNNPDNAVNNEQNQTNLNNEQNNQADASTNNANTPSNNQTINPNDNPGNIHFNKQTGDMSGANGDMPNNARPSQGLNSRMPGAFNGGGGSSPSLPGANAAPPQDNKGFGARNPEGSPASDAAKNLATGKSGNNDAEDGGSNSSSNNKTGEDNKKESNDKKGNDLKSKPSIGAKIAQGASNTVKKIGNTAKNGLNSIGKSAGDDGATAESDDNDTGAAQAVGNIANKAKDAVTGGVRFIMALPIPIIAKVAIFGAVFLLFAALLFFLILSADQLSSVDYGSKYMCSVNIKVDDSTTIPVQDYINGVVYDNYYSEDEDFVKAFTILMSSNIYYDYNQKDVLDTSVFPSYSFSYTKASIPSSCLYLFCPQYDDTEEDEDIDKEDTKLYACMSDLGNRHTMNFGEFKDDYEDEDIPTIEQNILDEFSNIEIVDAELNKYIADPIDLTVEVANDMIQLANSGSSYLEILRAVQGKQSLETQTFDQCYFPSGVCKTVSGVGCDGTFDVNSVPTALDAISLPGCNFGACAISSGLSRECVTWVKYRVLSLARSIYGEGSIEASTAYFFAQNAWGNAGQFRVDYPSFPYAVSTDITAAQPGALIEWGTPSGGVGHIAFIESVNGDTVTISNGGRGYVSNWGISMGIVSTTTISSGLYYGKNYVFLRYIYPFSDGLCEGSPAIDPDDPDSPAEDKCSSDNYDRYRKLVTTSDPIEADYNPTRLTTIPENYRTMLSTDIQLSDSALQAFTRMRIAMNSDLGTNLYIRAGWRSLDRGSTECTRADDGYCLVPAAYQSENMLGYAINIDSVHDDRTTNMLSFGTSHGVEEYNWLVDNAYKYGFIQRYEAGVEDVTGYTEQKYHFKYIGTSDAKKYHDGNYKTYEQYYCENLCDDKNICKIKGYTLIE